MTFDLVTKDILQYEYISEYFDLIVADPPYYKLDNCWDKKQFVDYNHYLSWSKMWIEKCFYSLKNGGSFYCFINWENVCKIKKIAEDVGFSLYNWIIWERNKGRSSNTNYKSIREDILFFVKGKNPKTFNPQLKIRPVIAPYKDKDGKPKGWYVDEKGNRMRWTGVGNIWHYTPPVWSSKNEKPFHPTQKPEAMLERIILSSSNENDMVLDLFSGSGVCSTVCLKNNRNVIAVEKDEEYSKKILERVSNNE